MKIILALDSFKGTLSAQAACEIVSRAFKAVHPEVQTVLKPMADGGEGTADILSRALNGEWIEREVTGPFPEEKVMAGYAWLPEKKTAVIEMASASGITRVPANRLNPFKTTTFGTGELIDNAIEKGASGIWLTVGGSATVDGGVGAASALGWRFLDRHSKAVPPGGGGLSRIAEIVPPADKALQRLHCFNVICDVDNPLLGVHGAARVYGPQKGATAEMVEELEAGLANLAGLVKRELGMDIAGLPGAGAAGGLAAGAVAFMGGEIVCGIDAVVKAVNLERDLADADYIITGEGTFDAQSLRGKVVAGIARAARAAGVPVAVLAGVVNITEETCREHGIAFAFQTKKHGATLEESMARAENDLYDAAAELAASMSA